MPSLQKINNAIIDEGFPELRDDDIQVSYRSLKNFLAICILENKHYCIYVSPEMKGSPNIVLSGILVHENCHMLKEKHMNNYQRKKDKRFYKSKIFKTLDERNTDLEAILRGYGREILAYKKYAEEMGLPYYEEDGLSVREIEKIILH